VKIVFMGTPSFAVPTLEKVIQSRHDLLAVVTGRDVQRGRGRQLRETPVKSLAKRAEVPILQPASLREQELHRELQQLAPDLFVVVAFRILPKSLIAIPRQGAINLHASLLPRYRGAAPIQWALLNGDKETGLTVFQIQPKVDTGDILLQRRVAIAETDTAGTLSDKLSQLGAGAIVEVLDGLADGELEPIPQNNQQATRAPKIYPEMGRLDWTDTATRLKNRIHGLSPSPGAYTWYARQRLKILQAHTDPHNTPQTPGTIVLINKEQLAVQTGDGCLYPDLIQREGKKALPIAEFLRGFNGAAGEHFHS